MTNNTTCQKLTIEQIKHLREHGYVLVEVNGQIIKVTHKNIAVSKEDLEKIRTSPGYKKELRKAKKFLTMKQVIKKTKKNLGCSEKEAKRYIRKVVTSGEVPVYDKDGNNVNLDNSIIDWNDYEDTKTH